MKQDIALKDRLMLRPGNPRKLAGKDCSPPQRA